ncbi:MAG: hypothetical protein AAF790_04825, partial [Planctomycetota bacterium]
MSINARKPERSRDSADQGRRAAARASSAIVGEAAQRLRQCPHFARHAEAVDLLVDGETLVLTGRVPSFYLKQVLQASLQGLPGVTRTHNPSNVITGGGHTWAPPRPGRAGRAPPAPPGRADPPGGPA